MSLYFLTVLVHPKFFIKDSDILDPDVFPHYWNCLYNRVHGIVIQEFYKRGFLRAQETQIVTENGQIIRKKYKNALTFKKRKNR